MTSLRAYASSLRQVRHVVKVMRKNLFYKASKILSCWTSCVELLKLSFWEIKLECFFLECLHPSLIFVSKVVVYPSGLPHSVPVDE